MSPRGLRHDETLEAAVARVHGPADELLPQHPEEVDLDKLSEKDLLEMSQALKSYTEFNEAQCREKLENMRGFRSKANAGVDHPKMHRAINALRARIKLLMREQNGSKWRATMEQHNQQQGQQQHQQQAHQQHLQIQGQRQAGQQQQQQQTMPMDLPGGTRASYFTTHQQGPLHGKQSDRLARALAGQEQPWQQGRVLDSVMTLPNNGRPVAHQPAAVRKPVPQPSRQPNDGPQYSSNHPSYYAPQAQHAVQQQQHQNRQQQQQHLQALEQHLLYQQQQPAPRQLIGPQLPPAMQQQQQQQSQGYQPLPLVRSQPGDAAPVQKAKHTWGLQQQRRHQQVLATCGVCNKPAAELMRVDDGMQVCQQCFAEQTARAAQAAERSQGMKAAPLRQDMLPTRPGKQRPAATVAVAAAGRAAVAGAAGRGRRAKHHGNKDTPITIYSDEEEEQQQRPGAAAAGGGIEEVVLTSDGEGPEGCGRRRRSLRINLLDPEPCTALKFAGLHMVFPPESGKGAVAVTPDDLARLDDGEFLNDTIIDFYIKWIELMILRLGPDDVRRRFHFFNSFFFKKLTEKNSEAPGRANKAEKARHAHARVKTWTRGVNIFEKDFLFVPIHDALHWSLAIVCHPALIGQLMELQAAHAERLEQMAAATAAGTAAIARPCGGAAAAAAPAAAGEVEARPCIIHLDSMTGGHTTQTIANALRSYLEQEWLAQQAKKQEAAAAAAAAGMDSKVQQQQQQQQVEVPQGVPCQFDSKLLPSHKVSALPKQDNHCDCGLFMLAYMEYFVFANPPALNVDVVNSKSKVRLSVLEPQLMRDGWFDPEVAYCLRGHLRHKLLQLMLEQAQDKDTPGAVAAAADIAEYNSQLQVHRQDLQERGCQVNPIFCYVPPADYAAVRQQLEKHRRHQEDEKKRRSAAAAEKRCKSGAERKRDEQRRQQQQQVSGAQAAAAAAAGSGDLFGVDYYLLDDQPAAAGGAQQGDAQQEQREQQHQPRQPQHPMFSVPDDDEADAAAAGDAAAGGSSRPAGKPAAAGGGCRPAAVCAAAGWQGDEDEDGDFQPASKRRSGGGQQQCAKRAKPSPQQQQQQRQQQRQQQHGLHPKQEEGPVLGAELQQQPPQQQQQQQRKTRRRLQQTGQEQQQQHARQQRQPQLQCLMLCDGAGGSAPGSDSLGSAGGGPGQGPVGQPQQPQPRHVPKPHPASGGADVDEAEDMSADEPAFEQLPPAAAAAAPEPSAQPAAVAPRTCAAAAAADTVDLCSDVEEQAPEPSSKRPKTNRQQQGQQREAADVSDSDWETAEGSGEGAQQQEEEEEQEVESAQQQQQQDKRCQQAKQRQRQQQQRDDRRPEEEAYELLYECLMEDASSMMRLWSLLQKEFGSVYGIELWSAVRSGAVEREDQEEMLDMISKELGEGQKKLRKSLLPYLLEKVQLLAADANAQAAATAQAVQAWRQTGLGQGPAQPAAAAAAAWPGSGAKRGRGRSAAAAAKRAPSRSTTAAAGAAADNGQRKVTDLLPCGAQLEFAADLGPDGMTRSVQRLAARAREEHEGGSEQQQGPEGELRLHLDTQDDDAAAATADSNLERFLPQQQQGVEVVDISDSDDEVVVHEEQQQQQQQQPGQSQQQPQQPAAAPPWLTSGPAAQAAQRERALALQLGAKARVEQLLKVAAEDELPAGVASWRRQQQQQQQQQQQRSPLQQSPAKGKPQQQQAVSPFNPMGVGGFMSQLQGQLAGLLGGMSAITRPACQQQQQPHHHHPEGGPPLPPDVMPYATATASGPGSDGQPTQRTESVATGGEDATAADLQQDVTSPRRQVAPLAAAAAAPAAGRGQAASSGSKQATAAAKLINAVQLQQGATKYHHRPNKGAAVGTAQG